MPKSIQVIDEEVKSYVAVEQVRVFDEEMRNLYLLSFLLTADHDRAEKCLISAIARCGEGIGSVAEWERLWKRRIIFEHAIQMVMPSPDCADNGSFMVLKDPMGAAENNLVADVLSLGSFERFVFVMSVLEGVSDEECAILLNCSQRDVMMSRVLTLLRQSGTDAQYREIQC